MLHLVAKEPHPRLVVAYRADDRAELVRDQPGEEQIAKPERRRRGPEEPQRERRLRHMIETGNVLQPREAIVSAQPAVVLEQVERQRQRHRLRQDRQVNAGDAASERKPAKDQRQKPRHQHHHRQLQRQRMGKAPERRQLAAAHHAKDLAGDGVGDLGIGRWNGGGQKRLGHDALGAGIHQPHADGIAADPEKREMAQAEDAAIAPDHIHRHRDQTQAERHAEYLDHRGGQRAGPEPLGQHRHAKGKEREAAEKPQCGGLGGEKAPRRHRALAPSRAPGRFPARRNTRRNCGHAINPPRPGP